MTLSLCRARTSRHSRALLERREERTAPPLATHSTQDASNHRNVPSFSTAVSSIDLRRGLLARRRLGLLAEAVLGLARQVLFVAHAARPTGLPTNHLLAPVVMAQPRRRVAAACANLLLDVEGGAPAAPAPRVRLLNLLL